MKRDPHTDISSLVDVEGYEVLSILHKSLLENDKEKITISRDLILKSMFFHFDALLYGIYLQLRVGGLNKDEQKQLLEHRGKIIELYHELLLSVSNMGKEAGFPFYLLGAPTIRDRELATALKEEIGWEYEVDESELEPDPRGIDPSDPTGELTKKFHARKRQILQQEFDLPEVRSDVAALVKKKLGVQMPVSEKG